MSNYAILTETINTATFNSENWNADGSINWSFVDADAYMDCKNLFRSDADFYEAFDEIVTALRAEMREEAKSEAQFEMATS
jgi:hypothetical protein